MPQVDIDKLEKAVDSWNNVQGENWNATTINVGVLKLFIKTATAYLTQQRLLQDDKARAEALAWFNDVCDAIRDLASRTENGDHEDYIRAVLSAGQSVPQWQPIETAPKDGTMILLLMPSGNCYQAHYEVTADWSSWYTPTVGILGDPTHWMTAPKLPLSTAPHTKGE